MSDGISDGRRERGLDDILATGAAWITENELEYIGRYAKQFESLWRRAQAAMDRATTSLEAGDLVAAQNALTFGRWGHPTQDGSVASSPVASPIAYGEDWRDPATAPREYTLVRLLVDYRDLPGYETEDTPFCPLQNEEIAETIGHRGDEPDDEWQFVGWDWHTDEWVNCVSPTYGRVIGWLPYPATPPLPVSDKDCGGGI